MEPEAREFLRRVMMTIFMGLFWLIINSTAGIMYNLAFVEDRITMGNILFYIWFITSLLLLLWYLKRLWSKPLPQE